MINKLLNEHNQNIVHGLMYDTRELLQKNEFEKANIQYVLVYKYNPKKSIIGITDRNYDIYEVILFDNQINYRSDWDYGADPDIFALIEDEYEIGFMSMDFNSGIWKEFDKVEIGDIEHKLGFQKYLHYCKNNGIDKNTIDKETKSDVPDIMKYYQEKTDHISIKDGKVEMPKEMYLKENEISYIRFCLGYDLLNNMLSNSNSPECDISYEFCDYLTRKFVESENYKNMNKSLYDNLVEWVNENKDIIINEHSYRTDEDDKLIIEIGKRDNQPIVLVEQHFKDGKKEYIIGFNYEIKNIKLDWGYGYYYMQNIDKAKADFEKVKAGGNLDGTFEEKNKQEEKQKTKPKYRER